MSRNAEQPSQLVVRSNLVVADLIPHKRPGKAQLILVAGKREQGKTALLHRYLQSREPRVLAFDPFDDFKGLLEASTPEEAVADLKAGGPCRRRLVPPLRGSREWAAPVFDLLGSEDGPRDYLLVLDEITLWSKPQEGEELERLNLQGRRLGVRMLVAVQKVSLTPGTLLSEATDLVVLHVSRTRDLYVLDQWEDGLGQAARTLPKRRAIWLEV